MTYFPEIAIKTADSPSIDAFDRLRTGSPFGLHDGKILFADNPLIWDDQTTSGAASSAYNANTSSATLSLSAQTGTRVRQTIKRYNYQAGKSQLVLLTFTLGAAVANVTKRVGYFDEQNGLFLQQTNTALSFVVRTYTGGSASDADTVPQSSWNLDKMDGTGISGIALDVTKSQIMVLDFEWLGVGRVRFGFVIAGRVFYCHESLHANVTAGVYMTTPNLPIRYELSSSANATASLECICSAVMSEGGYDPPGIQYAIDRGITGFSTGNDTNRYPLLSYRLKSNHKGARINLQNITLLCTTAADYRWSIVLNPTIAGTALSFADVTNTGIQAALGTTNATTASGGFTISAGYGSSTNQNALTVQAIISSRSVPGFTIAGAADIIALCIENLSAGVETYYASISLSEGA